MYYRVHGLTITVNAFIANHYVCVTSTTATKPTCPITSLLKVKVTLTQLLSGTHFAVGRSTWAALQHSPWPEQGLVKQRASETATHRLPAGQGGFGVFPSRLQAAGPHSSWKRIGGNLISCDTLEEQDRSWPGISYLATGDPSATTLAGVAVVVPAASICCHLAFNQALLTQNCRPIRA